MLLCSSYETKFAKKNLFGFLGPYIAIWKKKREILGYTQNQNQLFLGRNKKKNHKLSKAFYFIKIYVKAAFIEFFCPKGSFLLQLKQI